MRKVTLKSSRKPDPILEWITRLKIYIVEVASLIAIAWFVYESLRHDIGF
jgi:hypothetical protein